MPLPLERRTVALAESRQIEDLANLLQREGATILRCPMLSILDLPDAAPALAWLQELVRRPFGYTIFLTGEGVRRLAAVAESQRMTSDLTAALARSRLVTRGPKPVKALRELGSNPTLVAPTPTTVGVIDALKTQAIQGTEIGVQLYPDAPATLTDFLKSAGANVHAVTPYVYAPDADAEQVADLIAKMADGFVDVIVFTSSPQVDRMFEVARERKFDGLLADGWQKTKVAAIGPVVAANLRERGVPVHIVPEQGFVMKNLVQHISRALAT
jgi:uroporphyrinogen-III synthase